MQAVEDKRRKSEGDDGLYSSIKQKKKKKKPSKKPPWPKWTLWMEMQGKSQDKNFLKQSSNQEEDKRTSAGDDRPREKRNSGTVKVTGTNLRRRNPSQPGLSRPDRGMSPGPSLPIIERGNRIWRTHSSREGEMGTWK